MITSLDRINALARKSKKQGLTAEEKIEQQALRANYLSEIRGQVVQSFKGMTVIDPLGEDVTPEKVRELQSKNKKLVH